MEDQDDFSSSSSSDDELSNSSFEQGSSEDEAARDFETDDEDATDVPLINWKQIPANTSFNTPRFPFTGQPGIKVPVDKKWTPLDYVKLFLDDEIINIIVTETNRYADKFLKSKYSREENRKKYGWTPVNSNEIWMFLAVLIYQGIIGKPKQRWYWSRDKKFETPFMHDLMTLTRFEMIMKFLHFENNESYDAATHPSPKLKKIWKIYDALNKKFSKVYVPERDVSIDESLMPCKHHLSFKQYIPLKRARFGVKFFVMCESKSGYIVKTILYTGKDTEKNTSSEKQSVTTSIVLKICEDLLYQGYCLIMDNYYNSPELYDILLSKRTDAYGTLRKDRKGLPGNFSKIKLKKDQAVCWEKEGLLVMKWHDKKVVSLISTCHDASFQEVTPKHGEKKLKPSIVLDYNKTMGGVDRADQQMSSYTVMRNQQRKYYKKIFRHLLDQAFFNAYVLYTKYKCNNCEHLTFRVQLIVNIMKVHSEETRAKKTGRPRIERNLYGDSTPARLSGRHFPKLIPETAEKSNPTRRCAVCSAQKVGRKAIRRESRYYCQECGVGLCVVPCFEKYHTKEEF